MVERKGTAGTHTYMHAALAILRSSIDTCDAMRGRHRTSAVHVSRALPLIMWYGTGVAWRRVGRFLIVWVQHTFWPTLPPFRTCEPATKRSSKRWPGTLITTTTSTLVSIMGQATAKSTLQSTEFYCAPIRVRVRTTCTVACNVLFLTCKNF